MQIKLLDIMGSSLEPSTNQIVLNSRGPSIGGDDEDSNFIEGPVFGSLGVSSRPFGPTDKGNCIALVDDTTEITLGMRDPRIGSIYGELDPGDTCLHSTEDTQSTRLILKGIERQAALVVDKADGKQMVISISGKDETLTIAANGATLNFAKDGSISFLNKWGAGLVVDKNGPWLKGSSVKLGPQPKKGMNLTPTQPISSLGAGYLGTPVNSTSLPGTMSTLPMWLII